MKNDKGTLVIITIIGIWMVVFVAISMYKFDKKDYKNAPPVYVTDTVYVDTVTERAKGEK